MTLKERYDRAISETDMYLRSGERYADELMGAVAIGSDRVGYLENSVEWNSDKAESWSNTASILRAELVAAGELEPTSVSVNS
jgi:hypothetical protein